MIDFLSNHGVQLKKEKRRFQTISTAFSDNIENQIPKMEEKTVEIVCLIQQGQEILCDDEEFFYERRLLKSYLPGS
jgi:hypothetical protein